MRALRLVLIKANGLGSGLVFGLVGAMATSVSTARTALEVVRLSKHKITAFQIPIACPIQWGGTTQSFRLGCYQRQGFIRPLRKRHGSKFFRKKVRHQERTTKLDHLQNHL